MKALYLLMGACFAGVNANCCEACCGKALTDEVIG